MSKETSRDSKITLKIPSASMESTKKSLSPLNNNVVKKLVVKKRKKALLQKSPSVSQILQTEHKEKNKIFSLEKVIDFMKNKNNELIKEVQEQIMRNTSIEEQKANLLVHNKNTQDLYKKLLEEIEHVKLENSNLKNSAQNDKNRLNELLQQVNYLQHEVEHLTHSRKRLTDTVQSQENFILAQKEAKQKLGNSISELHQTIATHCLGENDKRII